MKYYTIIIPNIVRFARIRRPTPYTTPNRLRFARPVQQAALDDGKRFCFLFTDAANPTSNHIYQEIGYEHVRDVHIYRFDPR